MVDEKLKKAAGEEDQTDLWDPTLPPEHPYYNYTKEEYAKEMEENNTLADQYYEAEAKKEKKRLEDERHRLKELPILQTEDGAVFERDWWCATAKAKEQYKTEDFPKFVKTLRSEVLELTLEAMGYSIGVSKNQMARIEAGSSEMTSSNMMLMFDQVEKALIRQGKEWYSLGEFEVDQLIPDMYKKLRGWVYGRSHQWHYNSQLFVNNAVPPLLEPYPEQSIPATDPDKFDRVFANFTKADRDLIKKGELEATTFEMRKYIEDAKQAVANSPKKKPKDVVVSWAVLERLPGENASENVDPDLVAQYKSTIEVMTRKYERLSKSFNIREKENQTLSEELDLAREKLATAEKMTALYENQMRHNKAMADQGLTKAIIGLPTPPPEKLTVDDIDEIPEEVQDAIFEKLQEEHHADLAADAQMEDAKMREYENK